MLFYFALLAAVGSGLIAGTFFVFSVAIMEAFRRLPAEEGMAAMKSINVVIQNPIFLGVFIGTALLSLAASVFALLNWNSIGARYVLAGSLLYFFGSFIVTVVFNVPLNNALDAADAGSDAGKAVWSRYLSTWTFWNHVRTVASLAAMILFLIAISVRPE